MRRLPPEIGFLLLAAALFATFLFKHISYPLLWQDEGETVMFATRVLEYGYPKVHGARNVLYEFGTNIALGIDERSDAYIGTTWGHFYAAVPGVLWARGASDRYDKTARLRLPFAAAGAVGVGVWVLALTPVFGGDRRRARLFAALFLLLAAGSISLLLHLREVRYYSLLVLLVGCIAFVQLRRRCFGRFRGRGAIVGLAVLLFLVFQTFFAAYFVLAALLVIDALWASRQAATPQERHRRVLVELAPVLASGLLVAPFTVFFETFSIAAAFRSELGLTLAGYAQNLAFFARHFATHELLVPAVVARAAVVALERLGPARPGRRTADPGGSVAARLAWFVAGYAALTSLNPLVYERYFVVLSPAVTGLFLLDAFSLVALAPRWWSRLSPRAAAGLAGLTLAVLVIAAAGGRIDDVRGRIREITVPYRGPLDFAIAAIAARSPHPEDLVIATNYANHPLMYYLGSHVIVGTNLNNIVAERRLVPDVVIPRRRWPRGHAELRAFLARGGYRREVLPVRDVHFNNVPALTRTPTMPDVHRFATPTATGEDRLALHWRDVETP